MMKYGRKYELLSSRIGLMGGPFQGWEDLFYPDYDDRTFKQISEYLEPTDFLNELLDLLFFDVVNGVYLSEELGVFEKENEILVSKNCFNPNISAIKLHFDQQFEWLKTELKSISIKFDSLISIEDILPLLLESGFKKDNHLELNFERFIKNEVDVWYYKNKKPTISFNYKKEENGFKILKIAYEGQPFS